MFISKKGNGTVVTFQSLSSGLREVCPKQTLTFASFSFRSLRSFLRISLTRRPCLARLSLKSMRCSETFHAKFLDSKTAACKTLTLYALTSRNMLFEASFRMRSFSSAEIGEGGSSSVFCSFSATLFGTSRECCGLGDGESGSICELQQCSSILEREGVP